MLVALTVRGFPLIDKLSIEFEPGLNILTGETGAGKTVLLDALGFVLGSRPRSPLSRKSEVEAVFAVSDLHPAFAILENAGLSSGGDLVFRRISNAAGRSTAYVNDRRINSATLNELRKCLIEIQGQKDDVGLLDASNHIQMLDVYAGVQVALNNCRSAWTELCDAKAALADVEARQEANRADEATLRHAVQEFDELAFEQGEDDDLTARRRALKAIVNFRTDLSKASELLGSRGAEKMMSDALRWLENVRQEFDGKLDDCVEALERAITELCESSQELDRIRSDLEFDPMELERVEERLFKIREIARKYSVRPSEMEEKAQEMHKQLVQMEQSGGEAALLADAVASRRKLFDRLANNLSSERKEAGLRLDQSMLSEFAPLKLAGAVFRTEIQEVAPSAKGHDGVVFSVATIPGESLGPIGRIASGGELSRFLLALKLCLAADSSGQCLIFDEIDRGVGGATADAIGMRLRRLARTSQVIVVTHSPQVASYGECHWVIERTKGQAAAQARRVDGNECRDEIARMLSGSTVTDESRMAAAVLVKKSAEAFGVSQNE